MITQKIFAILLGILIAFTFTFLLTEEDEKQRDAFAFGILFGGILVALIFGTFLL